MGGLQVGAEVAWPPRRSREGKTAVKVTRPG